MRIKYILITALIFIFASCQKMKYDKQYSWSYPVSGDWTITVDDGTDKYGPIPMKIYNTSFGQDSIWIDDDGNFWPFKVKAAVDMKARVFTTTNTISYPNTNTEDFVTITKGSIVKTDSVYFEAVFASDPTTTYKMYGHRRVSYEEYNNMDL
jgi:hypothetical protein